MRVDQTDLAGVLVLTPQRFADDRGWFSEVWNQAALADAGISIEFVQDNHSYSEKPGTLRGLHYQSPPHAQDKLVRCARGAVLDVAVDVRKGSPSYAHWVGVELSAENGKQLLVPKGFLHGFVTRTAHAEVQYKCSDHYAPDCDGAVRFDDPEIGIDWGVAADDIVLSAEDANAPFLKDSAIAFTFDAAT